MNNNKMN